MTALLATTEELQGLHRRLDVLAGELRLRVHHDLVVLRHQRQLRSRRLSTEAERLLTIADAGTVKRGQAFVLKRAAEREQSLADQDEIEISKLTGVLHTGVLAVGTDCLQMGATGQQAAKEEAMLDVCVHAVDAESDAGSANRAVSDLLEELHSSDHSCASLLEHRRQQVDDLLDAEANIEPPVVDGASSAGSMVSPVTWPESTLADGAGDMPGADKDGDVVPVVHALAADADGIRALDPKCGSVVKMEILGKTLSLDVESFHRVVRRQQDYLAWIDGDFVNYYSALVQVSHCWQLQNLYFGVAHKCCYCGSGSRRMWCRLCATARPHPVHVLRSWTVLLWGLADL